MTTLSLPIVNTCSVAGCSYNHDLDCHAGAITVMEETAACATFFIDGSSKGGVNGTGMVGACHRTDCVHNAELECTATGVEIGMSGDVADCLTFASVN